MYNRKCWRSLSIGYTPRRAAHRKCNKHKKEMCISGNQVGGEEPFTTFGIRHNVREFGASTAGFQFFSGPLFHQNICISLLWNFNVYSVSFYVGSILQKKTKDLHEIQRRL